MLNPRNTLGYDVLNYHWLFTEGNCDVGELFKNWFVVFQDHLLNHLNVLEGGQPELGNALHVLALFGWCSVFLFLFVQLYL